MASAQSTLSWNTPRLLFTGGMYVFWFLVALALTLFATDWLLKPATYPVKSVSFSGPFAHVSQAEIEKAALPRLTGSFLTLDLDAARQQVESIPWVERAWVSRRWPNAVHIRFTEQEFVARWNDGAWLSETGIAVSLPNRDGPAEVVQLMGPEGTETQTLAIYRELSQQLRAIGLEVKQVELTRRRMWTVLLSNDIELVIGRDRLSERITRFIEIYPLLINERRRMRRIDLRYANGLAVIWADGRRSHSRQRFTR
jgi:cell division protein FtsQ